MVSRLPWPARVLALTAALAGAQRAAEAVFTHGANATGEIIDLSGEPTHVVVDGPGPATSTEPAIVFANGLGGAWFDWDPVVRTLRPDLTAVRFDRPGLGWSPGPTRVTSAAIESERLLAVARAVGAPLPIVLVGWSYGGFLAQVLARRHPDMVAAVVLVESSCVDARHRYRAPANRPRRVAAARLAMRAGVEAGLGVPVGLVGRAASLWLQTDHARDPALRRERRAVYGSRRAVLATVDELFTFDQVEADLGELQLTNPFPPIPVRIITGCASRLPHKRSSERSLRQQRSLLGLSPNAEMIELPDAAHVVMADRPDAVVAAIEDVITQLG